MRSLYNFIVKPLNKRYDNTKKINDKTLIVNTSIKNHKFVSKKAIIVSIPSAFKTKIKVGDIVYIHHNVFRRWYDNKGRERNSSLYFKDNLWLCSVDQIYMYNDKPFNDYCFLMPVLNNNNLSINKEKPNVGIVKYSNSTLEALGITTGATVTFTPNSEFEFIIDNERLYCMKSNDIAILNEHEGNEKEYNPSWAKSG
jgi:hypothetical protein|tara:strand:- start:191 stop:784 length:594 start_codon:yes stop_codon:yes gene_type:complete